MAGHRKFRVLVAETLTPAQQAAAHARADAMQRALPLKRLQHARDLTRGTLAEVLELSPSGVSRMEHTADTFLTTLRSYLHAMGGSLEIIAHFPDGDVPIARVADIPTSFESAEITDEGKADSSSEESKRASQERSRTRTTSREDDA